MGGHLHAKTLNPKPLNPKPKTQNRQKPYRDYKGLFFLVLLQQPSQQLRCQGCFFGTQKDWA